MKTVMVYVTKYFFEQPYGSEVMAYIKHGGGYDIPVNVPINEIISLNESNPEDYVVSFRK
jgi:hypothetical protein